MDAYRWTGSAWQLAGTSGARQCATDPYSLEVTGISSFSPFALSSGGSGPTSITLRNFAAHSSSYSAVSLLYFILGLVALSGGLLVWKRRHA